MSWNVPGNVIAHGNLLPEPGIERPEQYLDDWLRQAPREAARQTSGRLGISNAHLESGGNSRDRLQGVFATNESHFSEAPWGRLSPRSH